MARNGNVQVVPGGFFHVGIPPVQAAQLGRLHGGVKRLTHLKSLVDIDLVCSEALRKRLDPLHPIPYGRRVVHVFEIVAVRVHGAPVAERAAKQPVNRLAGDLARKIPQRDVDPANSPDRRQERVLHRSHAEEMALDRERIRPQQPGPGSHVFDMTPRHGGIRPCLSVTCKSRVGLYLNQAPVECVIERHGFDRRNLNFALVRPRDGFVARHPCAARQRKSNPQQLTSR